MISFIIIGYNEERFLGKCIDSVLNAIQFINLLDYEIIYVDSNSTDNSVEMIKNNYKDIAIYQITGSCNSAIARNIGAKESRGEILYFIDGDMEISKEFLPLVLNNNNDLIYDYISGQFIDVFYDGNGKLINHKRHYPNLINDEYVTMNGGLFIISRKFWNAAKGMNTKYKRSQDYDFSLRLAKMGRPALRKYETMANHHTIDYFHHDRIWKMLLNGTMFYQKCLLFREHMLNRSAYPTIIRRFYSYFILPFIFLAGFCLNQLGYAIACYSILHGTGILIRTIPRSKRLLDFLEKILFYFVHDWSVIIMTFFFFPKVKKEEYVRIHPGAN